MNDNTLAKIGDALGTDTTPNPGCATWHSVLHKDWGVGSYPYFIRGSGGLFSFGILNEAGAHSMRGTAVCGVGF